MALWYFWKGGDFILAAFLFKDKDACCVYSVQGEAMVGGCSLFSIRKGEPGAEGGSKIDGCRWFH